MGFQNYMMGANDSDILIRLLNYEYSVHFILCKPVLCTRLHMAYIHVSSQCHVRTQKCFSSQIHSGPRTINGTKDNRKHFQN